jgi:hypothetical protein
MRAHTQKNHMNDVRLHVKTIVATERVRNPVE